MYLLFHNHPAGLHHPAVSYEAVEIHTINEAGGVELHSLSAAGSEIHLLHLLALQVIDIDKGTLHGFRHTDFNLCRSAEGVRLVLTEGKHLYAAINILDACGLR